jgi:hypothetical protein
MKRAAEVAPTASELLGGAIMGALCGAAPLHEITADFFAIRWTLVEAVLKMRGQGLARDDAARLVLASVVSWAAPAKVRSGVGTVEAGGDVGASAATLVASAQAPSMKWEALFGFVGVDWCSTTFLIENEYICTVAWDTV